MKRVFLTLALSTLGVLSINSDVKAQNGPLGPTRRVDSDGGGQPVKPLTPPTVRQPGQQTPQIKNPVPLDLLNRQVPPGHQTPPIVNPPKQPIPVIPNGHQGPNTLVQNRPGTWATPAGWSTATVYHLGTNPDPTKRTVQMTFVDTHLRLRVNVIVKEHHAQAALKYYSSQNYTCVGTSYVR